MNSKQAELLQLHGLTEQTLSSANPDIKLEFANRDTPAVDPEPAVEMNALQREYLGDRALSEMTKSDRENLDWLGTFKPKIEEPTEAVETKPMPEAPVVVNAQSVLDHSLIKDLSPERRLTLARALEIVQRGARIGDGAGRLLSIEEAKINLAPYVWRKR
ncbi:hypothetical protein NKI48_23810 [Mesorhizobium sp. M0644]|uniref:hypothetical protein n=1 Tax=Mesorhizobium sp. M0644 TaxID=2956979 RepID=UPI003337A50E